MSRRTPVLDAIAAHARHRDRVALIAGEDCVTYARLLELVERAARELSRAGALAGRGGPARVGLDCPNGVAHVALALAVLRGGATLVPIAGELAPRERIALVRSIGLDAVVGANGRSATSGRASRGRTIEIGLPGFDAVVQVDPLGERGDAPAFDVAALEAIEPAFIRFSSGTTGASKGVVLSHATLSERIAAANGALGIGPDDRVLWMLPMAHHFAVSVLLYLTHGATVVLVSSHAVAEALAAARRHRATVLYAAPFHHALLAGCASARPWSELRLAISTTAPLPLSTARAFVERFARPLAQALGAIEVGLPAINLECANAKPESVGRPVPGFEVEVRDAAGVRVAEGEIGELFVRGPGMLDAYLSPWQPRSEVLRDGWFATGDLARVDADGDLFLVGRTRSAINVAGMKCFPEEIEAVLLEHPGIRAARVCARAHPRVGAVPVAEIVPADPASPPGEGELSSFCRAALARFKVPVEFRAVAALPLTASGKIRR